MSRHHRDHRGREPGPNRRVQLGQATSARAWARRVRVQVSREELVLLIRRDAAIHAAVLYYVKACTSRVAAVATSSNTSSRSEQPPSGPILEANSREGLRFDILSNPESLAEATSVSLSSIPIPRALKACPPKSLKDAREDLVNVYRHWVHRKRIFTTGLWSRELSQLVTNACITQRISSINAMAAICEATDADVDEVAHACGLDKRIGPKFLKANVGFGGSCCQKDILKLVYRWQSTEGR
ncbi:unnamed protein product [Tilletia caries]|nr:unnamed protein product [Tilletia caries]